MRLKSCALLAVATLAAPHVFASDCASNFKKSGNPFTGTSYAAFIEVPDLSVEAAMGQMRGLLIADKMDVITEDLAGGNMLVEQRSSTFARAVPTVVTAEEAGGKVKITMTVKTEKGVFAKQETVKQRLCDLFAKVQGGKAGAEAAAAGATAANKTGESLRDVFSFSRDIANEANLNAALVTPRHKGRTYALKGKIDYIQEDGDNYNVSFEIHEHQQTGLGDLVGDANYSVGVACLFRPNQLTWVLSMREGERVTFKGVFYRYDDSKKMAWLENCKQM
jgi:hypothetical protein